MITNFLKRLARSQDGSTIVEFAILAPVVLGLFFGVIQIGISMQAYNSLRGVASDTARWAVVKYMQEKEVTVENVNVKAIEIAQSTPYLLNDSIESEIEVATTPRVHGTHEWKLILTYTPPDILPFLDFVSKEQKFERPIFMIDE